MVNRNNSVFSKYNRWKNTVTSRQKGSEVVGRIRQLVFLRKWKLEIN